MLIDTLSALMLCLVTGIATLVHVYSLRYMQGEPPRYWLYLGAFCAAMCALVVAKSPLLLFCCWELVGFCSYLLIGFWREKEAPAHASFKAFITNSVTMSPASKIEAFAVPARLVSGSTGAHATFLLVPLASES